MSDEAALRTYLGEIERAYRAGNATEHTYRPYLKRLLEALAPGATATNEPKREACGAPDYVVTKGSGAAALTVGYVEAKDIGLSLDEVERSEQLGRYRTHLENLLLTDYVEFRWYVKGERHGVKRLASPQAGRFILDKAGAAGVGDLLHTFLGHRAAAIRSPRELAERMARLAHMIRDVVVTAFAEDAASDELKELYAAFQQVLIPELTEAEFADMFAQTLAYGLFAARYNHSGPQRFTRNDAAREIPRTNPFLRTLFGRIAGPELDDEPFVGFVDELAQVLATADMDVILADFGKHTRTEDPIVHFYETFLNAYDPKLRELRGVYYTPEPVVSYIVRSVDTLLRERFDCPDGLAEKSLTPYPFADQSGERTEGAPKVLVLDPACGTGTFLYYVIDQIREQFVKQNDAGMWPGYVHAHLLPRIFGFELLMAPYAMAHLKLGMELAALDMAEERRAQWAYDAEHSHERLRIYLTNTLDDAAKHSEVMLGRYLSEEANAAASVKKDYPVMVVLGNPPYSGHSANKGKWISALLRGQELIQGEDTGRRTESYFEVDGEPLGERNPKWLNDDYVKFLRFAQWRIARTGHGVLAFITNHGYLDNPTFRGMRQSLMRTFDEIYVLDLHGNSKKKERTPEGGPDENVFDIQQGVAIGIFVKRRSSPPNPLSSAEARGNHGYAAVHHAHLWGEREGKYAWLAEREWKTTDWTRLEPQAPFYLFVPRNANLAAEYDEGWKITDIMPVNVLGFQTHRDHFAIAFDADTLKRRFAEMRDTRLSDEQFAEKYELPDNPSWQLSIARQRVRADNSWQSRIISCLYRPFDKRAAYYNDVAMDRPRQELEQHMLKPNLSLNVTRQTRLEHWGNAVVADTPTPALYTEIKDGSNAFPLYLYPDMGKPRLFEAEPPSTAPGGRRPNLAPEFIKEFAGRLGLRWVADGKGDLTETFGPEDVFDYIYAVFYSPEYRERYAEFLKTDFPRVPLTRDVGLFRELCGLGERLVALHLMEQSAPGMTRYPVRGNDTVERVRYTAPGEGAEQGRVWINNTQYVEGVPLEVWEFHIGGYQVAEKWLKDRKGRKLPYDELATYQRIVAALAETRRLMEDVDEVIEEHGGWPIGG